MAHENGNDRDKYMTLFFLFFFSVQVLKGSHAAGRIEHVMVGGQTGADLERVEHLQKVRSLIPHPLSLCRTPRDMCHTSLRVMPPLYLCCGHKFPKIILEEN